MSAFLIARTAIGIFIIGFFEGFRKIQIYILKPITDKINK